MSHEHYTFISYSRSDAEFALRLASDLRSAGQAIWLDQLDIAPGARWDREVEQALKGCGRLLLILSPASAQSENVQDEIGYALQQHKLIIPVLHQPCDIPLRLLRLQYIDFTKDYGRGLQRLLPVMKGTDEEVARATGGLKMPAGSRTEPPVTHTQITASPPTPAPSAALRKWLLIGGGAAALLVLTLLVLSNSGTKRDANQSTASYAKPAEPSPTAGDAQPVAETFPCSSEALMKSPGGDEYAPLTIVNKRQEKLVIYWLDGEGHRSNEAKYGIEPLKTVKLDDAVVKGHLFVITAANGECLKLVRVPGTVVIE